MVIFFVVCVRDRVLYVLLVVMLRLKNSNLINNKDVVNISFINLLELKGIF